MLVYFVRHGEAMDDVEGRYGGWYDPELSPNGKQQAIRLAGHLSQLKIDANTVLSSPLKRAYQTATIIAQQLGTTVTTSVYLKERNTYGLLCGEKIDEAKKRYPDLVEKLDRGDPVPGQESYEDLLFRVTHFLDVLNDFNCPVLVCVTHGKFLGALFKDVLGKKAKKFTDCCFAVIEYTNGELKYLSSEGIEFQ